MPLITDSIGRVLGKRYRLLSALGTGASAHVYLAEDVSLQRHVAVKVLQPGLASDESFLKRFGAEARSVASLNHPHVLRVFDWGEDADGPYLVLEYLGGGSLRDLLDRGVRLTHSQAAQLGADVAQGLAYAHARGLVHRDVKPANLLFDEEGRVRIADFGVARALAEAAWTEPAGAMVGTARYVSPESAEGRHVDGRADVYSLALVLYEAVTGTVPFVADTTVGTLMARVGATLPRHPDLGPLDEVLARAAAPDAAARLDAAGFAARLGALASALPAPDPLPLEFQELEAPAAPVSSFRAPNVAELTQVAAVEPVTESTMVGVAVGTKAGPGEIFDAEARRDRSAAKAVDAPSPPPPPVVAVKQRRRPTWWIASAVALVVIVVAAVLGAVQSGVFTPSHPVPTLTNLSLAKAQAALAKDHFVLQVTGHVESKTVPYGSVISQSPRPGTSLKQGSTARAVVSLGPPPVLVPSLTGSTCVQAIATLKTDGLDGSCAPGKYDPTTPAGQLLFWTFGAQTDPTKAPYGSTVTLVPSLGHAPVQVPSNITTSDTFGEAQSALQAVGLTATQTSTTSTTVPSGQVISISPVAGTTVPFGSNVTVTISTGPPTVTVPDVYQDTVAQATATLQAANLTVGGAYGPHAGQPGAKVVYTTPAQGATVPQGTAVNLYTN